MTPGFGWQLRVNAVQFSRLGSQPGLSSKPTERRVSPQPDTGIASTDWRNEKGLGVRLVIQVQGVRSF